jgi:hypothetical protein
VLELLLSPTCSFITTTTTNTTTTAMTTTTTTTATTTVSHKACPVLLLPYMLPILQLSPQILKAHCLQSVTCCCLLYGLLASSRCLVPTFSVGVQPYHPSSNYGKFMIHFFKFIFKPLTLWHAQTAVSRSEPPMSLLLVLAFCQ